MISETTARSRSRRRRESEATSDRGAELAGVGQRDESDTDRLSIIAINSETHHGLLLILPAKVDTGQTRRRRARIAGL